EVSLGSSCRTTGPEASRLSRWSDLDNLDTGACAEQFVILAPTGTPRSYDAAYNVGGPEQSVAGSGPVLDPQPGGDPFLRTQRVEHVPVSPVAGPTPRLEHSQPHAPLVEFEQHPLQTVPSAPFSGLARPTVPDHDDVM